MKLKTILKLLLRSIALLLLFYAVTSMLRLLSVLPTAEIRQLRVDIIYTEIARSALFLIFGSVIFKYSDKLITIFGKDFDFDEKIEFMDSPSSIAAIYTIFGVWLIVFSVPDLIEEIIRLQTSYYGAAINDIRTAIQKYAIVSDISRLLIGLVLIKYNRWLPPLNQREITS